MAALSVAVLPIMATPHSENRGYTFCYGRATLTMAILTVVVLPIMATLTPRPVAVLPITAGPRRRLGRPGDRAARDGRARPGRLPGHAGGP